VRILVCGGRDYDDADLVREVLDEQFEVVSCIIHGGSRGADSLARAWAKRNGVMTEQYSADWRQYGKAAGPMRNQQMLNSGAPDLVIAFPGGRGTADMVRRAKDAGVPVREVK
jgi:hypothetical protein